MEHPSLTHFSASGPRTMRCLAVLLAFVVLLLVQGQPAAADAGPKPQMVIRVTYEGQPVPDATFQARVLACASGNTQPYSHAQPLPGLDELNLVDPAGCHWQQPSFPVSGGDCADGQCRFSYMLPSRFRLAIYLPSQDRLFITDAAERRGLHDTFIVDLSADGTSQVRRLGGMGRSWTLTGVAIALPLTLAIEAGIILLFARRRHLPRRRLLLTGLGANILTLPAVWLVAGLVAVFGGPQAGLAALALSEFGAWVVESAAYATVGRLSLGAALLLSLFANIASLSLGLLIH